MICIFGLGNPDATYSKNRHNVGQLMVDYMVKQVADNQVLSFKTYKILHAQIVKINESIVLAKSLEFMNNSGITASKLVNHFNLHVSHDLFVAHDDLDIPLGKFKIQKGTGPKLHNGLDSIENHLKTVDFYRIRIGVENRDRERRIPGEAYVLQNFTEEENNILTSTFPKIFTRLQQDFFLKGLST